MKLSDEEWKQRLTPMQFQVLRLKGTERAGTGEYNKHKETGVYVCAGCKTPVYTSTTKFDSGCGWPAFYDAIPGAIKVHHTRLLCKRSVALSNYCCMITCRLYRMLTVVARRSCAPSATGEEADAAFERLLLRFI